MPALEQKRSIGPSSASTVSIRRWMSASLLTSVVNARPPTLPAVALAPSPLMSAQITRLAPSSAKRSANARPIPLAAPVTTTILSLTCMRFVLPMGAFVGQSA